MIVYCNAFPGQTCHSVFEIPVGDFRDFVEEEDEERLEWLRRKFIPAQLIIIDEVSMISACMLKKIDSRLRVKFPEY